MKTFLPKKIFTGIVFLLLFSFFVFAPQKIFADESHARFFYEGTDSKGCSGIATDLHCYTSASGNTYCEPRYIYRCGSWQKPDAAEQGYMKCQCNAQCLDFAQNPKYSDDLVDKNKLHQRDENISQPKTNTDNPEDAKNISLPIILLWDNIRGWKNKGEGMVVRIDGDCAPETNFNDKGPKSYIIEIQDTQSQNGIDNLGLTDEQKANNLTTIGLKQAYRKVLDKNEFNSRNDGETCFFNSNSAYRWRVRPCCGDNGTGCKEYGEEERWWNFTTSPAPEPIGIVDKNHPDEKNPAQDPDWNGNKKLENVDFCSVKLLWCKTKLVVNDQTSKNIYSKIYNRNQLDFSASYQLRVKFSENWSLDIIKSSSQASQPTSIVESILQRVRSGIDYFNEALTSLAEQAIKGITGTDYQNRESCHYLQKQTDGNCKPDVASFSANQIQDKSFIPFFSASDSKSSHQDRNLFTGNANGDLTYSWQTKVCFDNQGTTNNPNYCNAFAANDSENYNEGYGQKWKFATISIKEAKIEPPNSLSPENNPNYDDTKLVGLDDRISWTTPCGANSFIYDIQKIGANSQTKSIFPDSETSASQGRLITNSQVFISLTDKDNPVQEGDPKKLISGQTIILELNTKYQWRTKSCWPSIPIGDVSGDAKPICSDQFSNWFNLFTTGRPPKTESLKASTVAPKTTFSWENVSGAKSYRVKIIGQDAPTDEKITKTNQFIFEYSQPLQTYSWAVKTCADDAAIICGKEWSDLQQYQSLDFDAPKNLNPSGDIKQLPPNFSWNSPAKYFLFNATYSGESDSTCSSVWFDNEYKDKIVASTSVVLKTRAGSSSQYCSGNYWFNVKPCFDQNCQNLSFNSSEQNFTVIDPSEKKTGFMVCGQKTNDPDTEYNEKEPCQIKHLFLATKIIIDFILFKLAFILLPVLVLISAGFFYFSEDKSKVIPTLKDAWKNIGIGYAGLFFAWLLVSWLMMIFGYQGSWWKIL